MKNDTPHDVAEATVFDEADRTLRDLMPWAISILLHAGIVVVGMLVVWTTLQPDFEPQKPANMSMVDTPPYPTPIENLDFNELQEENPTHAATNNQPSAAPPQAPAILDAVGHTAPPPSETHEMFPKTGPGGPGDGDGITGGPIMPTISAQKTVFVIDASGSLIDTLPFVIKELGLLLHKMEKARTETDKQYEFAVLFFRNGEVIELGGKGTGLPRGLKPATPENVTKAQRWLSAGATNIGPGGKTDPMPAIELALTYNPQAVVLLSDNITGRGIHALDPEGLIDAVMDLRRDRNIAFHTVQFLYPDPAQQYGQKGTLERLADETNGEYKFISPRKLDLQ